MAKATIALPGGITDRGDSKHDHLRWINIATGRDHDRLVGVHRFGFGLDSRIRLNFENGNYITVRQRDLLGANGLSNVLMIYDGGEMPAYSQHDVRRVVARVIWAAEASVRADDLEQLAHDVGEFLARSLADGGLMHRDYGDDGYALIADLATLNHRRTGELSNLPPVLAFDTSAAVLWVPRGPLAHFLRDIHAKVDPPTLRSQLEDLGWQHANFQRRQPQGDARPVARVWVVEPGWEACPFDLAKAMNAAPDPIRRVDTR